MGRPREGPRPRRALITLITLIYTHYHGRWDALARAHGLGERACGGLSLYVDKLYSAAAKAEGERATAWGSRSHQAAPDVLVCSVGGGLALERLRLVGELWQVDVRADATQGEEPELAAQMEQAQQLGVPYVLILRRAEDESPAQSEAHATSRPLPHTPSSSLHAHASHAVKSNQVKSSQDAPSAAHASHAGHGVSFTSSSAAAAVASSTASAAIAGGEGGSTVRAPVRATLRHLRSHRDTEDVPASGAELVKLLKAREAEQAKLAPHQPLANGKRPSKGKASLAKS